VSKGSSGLSFLLRNWNVDLHYKIILAPTLKGGMIFRDFHPLREGQEVFENHERESFEKPPMIGFRKNPNSS